MAAITKDESTWPIISLSLGETFDQETVDIADKYRSWLQLNNLIEIES